MFLFKLEPSNFCCIRDSEKEHKPNFIHRWTSHVLMFLQPECTAFISKRLQETSEGGRYCSMCLFLETCGKTGKCKLTESVVWSCCLNHKVTLNFWFSAAVQRLHVSAVRKKWFNYSFVPNTLPQMCSALNSSSSDCSRFPYSYNYSSLLFQISIRPNTHTHRYQRDCGSCTQNPISLITDI